MINQSDYVAVAFLTPSTDQEIQRLEAKMSVDDALHKLNGTLHPQVLTLVQAWRSGGTKPKTKKVMLASAHKSVMDKKNVEEARLKLNEMVEDTTEKWDMEAVECEASIRNQKALVEETAADMSLYNTQNTQARGDHLRATQNINTLSSTSDKVKNELVESRESCVEQIAQLKAEIAVMMNDSIILQKIVAMIECPKAAGLVQCQDTLGNMTTFEKPELRAQMAQVQSKKVMGLLNSAVVLGYKTGETTTRIGSRSAFLQQDYKSAQTLQRRQRVLRGRQELAAPDASTDAVSTVPAPLPPVTATGEAENGPGPDEEGCSLATNPNCGKLLDKFLEISGELDSDITVYEKHLEALKAECQLEHENYEAQISDLSNRDENWQTALAEATARATQSSLGEKMKRVQKKQLEDKLTVTTNDCATNIANFKSEICALGKIRGELYKMSAVPKAIVDCEVGDWVYGDCSKLCMETPQDMPGVQSLTRQVVTPATLGAKCPPLKLNQTCNMVQCPIDCVQSEWSEWSSCSTKCGGGVREKIRSTQTVSRYNGEPCGPASATEPCNAQDCDKDCVMGQWTLLSQALCSKACGGGTKVSSRPVIEAAIGQGECPEPFSAERFRQTDCNVPACMPQGPTLVCDSMVDVVIMLDGSGSLGQKGWEATVAMGQKLVAAFNAPNVQARAMFSVQLFGGPRTWGKYRQCSGVPPEGGPGMPEPDMVEDCGIEWVTPLTTDTGHFTADGKKAGDLIKALKWPATSTFTSLALAQAQAEFTYARDGATKVVVVVTDGMPLNPFKTTEAAMSLKKMARVIWVPVAGNAPKEQLVQWASRPTAQNIVSVEDFETLENPAIVTAIVAEICPVAK